MVRRYLKTAFFFSIAAVFVLLSGWVFMARRDGGQLLSVQSQSMAPHLSKGDLVNVKRVSAEELSPGDVITFINPVDNHTTVTHRIVEVLDPASGSSLITKGDANPAADIPIDAQAIVGKVVQVVPNAGYALDILRTWPGLILIIYLPAMLVIINEFKNLTVYYRRIKPYSYFGYHKSNTPSHKPLAIILIIFAIAGTFILPTVISFAALGSTASLTGNTISIRQGKTEPGNGNSVNCNNNTNVNVNVNVSQDTQSGDAMVEGNTSGGSATSGNASNSNTTNIKLITINESCNN